MAEWSAAFINDLPDGSFACVNDSGRHYPHHDASGALDLPHLRAALSRIGDPDNEQCGKGHLQAHAKAENVGEAAAKSYQVKATIVDDDAFDLLAIPFGGPIGKAGAPLGVDLDGEWFSERTDIKPDWLDVRVVDWQHGADPSVQRETLGRAQDLRLEDDGWWVRVWLERGKRHVERVRQLAEAGAELFGSTETLSRLVRKADSGEILTWPYLRQTISPVPINTLSVLRSAKALTEGAILSDEFWHDLSDLAGNLSSKTAATVPAPDGKLTERLGELHAELARLNLLLTREP